MLLENIKNKRILLVSKSPRRKQLLEDAGFKFEVISSKEVEEIIPKNISNNEAAVFLSELKANAYKADLQNDEILIAADTIVCLEDKILGKPKDYKDAFKMLTALSGKQHKVITGVTICSTDKELSFAGKTTVKFKELSEDEINYYITNYKPYDKAGSYGIQEWIGYIGITEIKGSYFNVMGLPVQKVYEVLRDF